MLLHFHHISLQLEVWLPIRYYVQVTELLHVVLFLEKLQNERTEGFEFKAMGGVGCRVLPDLPPGPPQNLFCAAVLPHHFLMVAFDLLVGASGNEP